MKKYKSIIRKGAKMTKKDFIKLADCLGVFQYHLVNNQEELEQEYENLVDNIKHICKSANNNFQSSLFDSAIDKSMTSLDIKTETFKSAIKKIENN